MCSGRAGTLLKLTVAATFVIELPATALILAPWRPLRVIGAALQAFLQVGGAATCFAAPRPGHGPAQACWAGRDWRHDCNMKSLSNYLAISITLWF